MRKLPVNLDELAFVLHRGSALAMDCFLDLDTGQIITIPLDAELLVQILHLDIDPPMLEPKSLIGSLVPQGRNLIHIPDNYAIVIFDLMADFSRKIEHQIPDMSQNLWGTIHNKGGFPEFRRIIMRRQGLLNQFIDFRDKYYRGKARKWLKENQILVSRSSRQMATA